MSEGQPLGVGSLSTMYILEIELRLLGMAARISPHWAISLALKMSPRLTSNSCSSCPCFFIMFYQHETSQLTFCFEYGSFFNLELDTCFASVNELDARSTYKQKLE